MKVRIKKLYLDAVIPSYAKPGDAGMDLTAISKYYDKDGNVHYGTGLAFEIPEGYVGLLFPRSSNAKVDLLLTNSVGVIDSGYRGEISFKFKPSPIFGGKKYVKSRDTAHFEEIVLPGQDNYGYLEYKIGDRIGQIIIIPYPQIEFEETNELSETERGDGAYGSSGK